jgi:GWxTD domain-containing protein
MSFIRHLFLLVLLACFPLIHQAQDLSPEVFMDIKGFYSITDGSYVEVYMTVAGNSVVYEKDTYGQYQAKVEVTLLVKKQDEIVDYIKKDLLGPASTDSVPKNFMDVHRFLLPKGSYEFEISVKDLKQTPELQKEYQSSTIYSLGLDDKNMYFSDIIFAAEYQKSEIQTPFTKSGYEIFPNTSNYFAPNINELTFYTELYHTDKFMDDDMFLLSYAIINHTTNRQVPNTVKMQRVNTEPVKVVMNKINITNLPTGNYNLVMEVRNKQNELLLEKRIFFYRHSQAVLSKNINDFSEEEVFNSFVNKISPVDTLRDYIYSLRPIGEQAETNFIDKHVEVSDESHLRKFFYTFWYNRYPENPEYAWEQYKQEVIKADRMFKTRTRRGYETDMGRVYLKYGPPNDVADRPNEPSAYPYQIWHYFKIDRYNNKRFVFYSPEMISQEYVLLHSDVPGEVRDPRWNYRIHSRTTPNTDIDQRGMRQQHWGGNIEEFWDLPR